ncbi:MAG: imidazolonepropionase [Tabrizicola sp.]|uniref:imidazolonepropionase n=1 Tax=Tabrizicola sp. TaxID=2005166 RepID=UPI002734E756|nr:imidazolonepropionase [Tabrizicola sp.]MDP3264518.1 imidazolonepropionase [Tabrizicola sp.]MDP3649502.1 imidazolonepropionase [Paracoccaceae bacterium]MDZ4069248.1 imidazolonepropionase [Tabrizicola sp.]
MLLTDATLATMTGGYGLIPDGAVAIADTKVVWVGKLAELPSQYQSFSNKGCGGRLITPGLIDCHTHVVFGGDRAAEFEMRLNGASYEAVARAGGGILSTVKATRAASEAELLAAALQRIDLMLAAGATVIEVKSGYGLTVADEVKMLRVARTIGTARRVHVVSTHLAAHAIPPEFTGRAAAYIAEVAIPSLRVAHAEGLVDQVDAFCEGIAFSPAELRPLFAVAAELGLAVKLHAEQLSDLKGAVMAAEHGALSADHLEYLAADGVAAMAAAGTVAVILPGAFYTLRETQAPPIAAFRAAGVRMAVATDMNPGSSPIASLPLAMNMACTLFRLTPEEALMGATVHAAAALGLADRGRIETGQRADLCIWEARHPAELSYRIGATPLHSRIFGGEIDR